MIVRWQLDSTRACEKHYWRFILDALTALIEAAEENGVSFVYAISPGLDITYSSSKDVQLLKKKLDQVSSFGCKSFALLFDDIEIEMCEADKEIFQSFAQAQVSVTNEVYQYFNQPAKFLFCPTGNNAHNFSAFFQYIPSIALILYSFQRGDVNIY